MHTRVNAGEWIELAVVADREAVESIAELFARYGYNEGVVIEEPFLQEADGDNLRVDLTKPVTVRTFIPAENVSEEAIDDIRTGLRSLGMIREVGPLTIENRREEDWANVWKEHYRPIKIGRRTVVRPPWHDYVAQGDEVVAIVDPGMAFGNGTHFTTRLCLVGLEDMIEPGMTVIDIGTGSGILAIAAALLGASKVDGVDIDAVSVRTANENVQRNGLADVIDLRVGSAGPGEPFQGQYTLVLANIIARVLCELHEGIVAAVEPGGILVLSGIIKDREAMTRETYDAHGLELLTRRQEEDWVSLIYRRPA